MFELDELKLIKENLPETEETKVVLTKADCTIKLLEAQNEYTGKVTEIKKQLADLQK